MNTAATTYAQTQADTFRSSLQYLIDAQNAAKLADQQALETEYQSLVDQLNQSKTSVQTNYAQGAEEAYVNKMLAQKQLNNNLSSLGLSTQGFGVSQKLANENSYSSNLADLMSTRNTSLQDIANNVATADSNYATNLSSLNSDYSNQYLSLLQDIESQVQSKYDTSYSNYVANQQYKDALKQQAIENAQTWASINASKAPVFKGGNPTETPLTINSEDSSTNINLRLASVAKLKSSLSTPAFDWLAKYASQNGDLVTAVNGRSVSLSDLKTAMTSAYAAGSMSYEDVTAIINNYVS